MEKGELFGICTYIAASAEKLKDEPKDYGPLRLLEVLSQLATLGATEYDDNFLREVVQQVKEKQGLVMADRKAFYDFLTQLVIQFVKEAKKR